MEDLIGLLVTLGVIFIWVVQNVFTGKKQAQQQFEEALQDLDEDDEIEILEEMESPARRPAQALAPPKREVPKGAPTWEDLQRQLQELLGAPSKPAPDSRQAEAQPQAEVPPRQAQPSADFPPLPPRERPAPFPIPRQISHPMERRPTPAPRPVPQQARVTRPEPALQWAPVTQVQTRAEPVLSPRRMVATRVHPPAHLGKFPHLHPNPLANAVLMGEILRPHSRKRLRWGG